MWAFHEWRTAYKFAPDESSLHTSCSTGANPKEPASGRSSSVSAFEVFFLDHHKADTAPGSSKRFCGFDFYELLKNGVSVFRQMVFSTLRLMAHRCDRPNGLP